MTGARAVRPFCPKIIPICRPLPPRGKENSGAGRREIGSGSRPWSFPGQRTWWCWPLGEDTIQGGEGGSRTRLSLPGDQMKLLREVRKRARKVVVVLFAGRPLVLDEVKELADALLLVWYPGTEGGSAIRDMLFGICEPQGDFP